MASNVIKFGREGGTLTMPEILERERVAQRRRRLGLNECATEELVDTTDEERYGAALMRRVVEHAHFVHGDEHASIVRLVIPNWLFDEMMWWGECDAERNGDLEADFG